MNRIAGSGGTPRFAARSVRDADHDRAVGARAPSRAPRRPRRGSRRRTPSQPRPCATSPSARCPSRCRTSARRASARSGPPSTRSPRRRRSSVIFAPSRAADCISMKWKPAAPSPVTQTTSRSGLPSFAPSAEGIPVPSMPSSRMLQVRARPRRRQEPVRPERREAAVGRRRSASRPKVRADRLHHARRDAAPAPPRPRPRRICSLPPRRRPRDGSARGSSDPSSRAARLERATPGRERRLHVGDDAERQRARHADVPRVDVDLHDALRARGRPSTCRTAGRGCRAASPTTSTTSASRFARSPPAPRP